MSRDNWVKRTVWTKLIECTPEQKSRAERKDPFEFLVDDNTGLPYAPCSGGMYCEIGYGGQTKGKLYKKEKLIARFIYNQVVDPDGFVYEVGFVTFTGE